MPLPSGGMPSFEETYAHFHSEPVDNDFLATIADRIEEKGEGSDGRVTKAEYISVINEVVSGSKKCPRALSAMFDAFAANTLSSTDNKVNGDVIVAGLSLFCGTHATRHSCNALVELYDVDHSGGLELPELTEFLLATATMKNVLPRAGASGAPLSHKQLFQKAETDAAAVMRRFDSNHNGMIDPDEFATWLMGFLKEPSGIAPPSLTRSRAAPPSMPMAPPPAVSAGAAFAPPPPIPTTVQQRLPPLPPPPMPPRSAGANAHEVAVGALFDACCSGTAASAHVQIERLEALGLANAREPLRKLRRDEVGEQTSVLAKAVERAARDRAFEIIAVHLVLYGVTDVEQRGCIKQIKHANTLDEFVHMAPLEYALAAGGLEHLIEIIRVKILFVKYDADHSGTIERSELRQLFLDMHRDFSDEELDEAVAEHDTNHDGTLQFEEFIVLYDHLHF